MRCIVLGVNNVKTRQRLFRVPDLTLEKALDVVRSAEATEKQIKELESDASVYGVKRETITPPNWKTPLNNEAKRISKMFSCRNCRARHGARECPAYGKTCHHCHKQHHFQSMWRSRKNIHGLTQEVEDEHDCESTLVVGAITTEVQLQDDECYVMSAVQGHIVKLKVDTGAQVNILKIKELKRISWERTSPGAMQTQTGQLLRKHTKGPWHCLTIREVKEWFGPRTDFSCSGNKPARVTRIPIISRPGFYQGHHDDQC